MTKRNFISLATLAALILSSAAPLFAQDGRQAGNDRTPINRQSQPRTIVTQRTAEQLRAQMTAVCDEAEATFNFMASYSIAQDGIQKIGYENMSGVLDQITALRKQIEAISESHLLTINSSFLISDNLDRLAFSLRQMRSNPGFQSSLQKAEKWFNSENGPSSGLGASKPGVRFSPSSPSSPSSPAFTGTSCIFNDLRFFPSAADIGITQGVLHVVNVIQLLASESLGNNVPNPVYYVAMAAKAITGAILLGLEGARDAGLWCQDIAFNIQDSLKEDAKITLMWVLPKDEGGYADYVKDLIEAIIARANEVNVRVNCATTRKNEGDVFYAAGNWLAAYKKYREAYANIGAANCQPQP